MRIRPYVAGEEGALLAIFQSSVRGLACRDYSPEQTEAWAPASLDDDSRSYWFSRIQSNLPWVAEVDGQLVGFADLQPSGYIDQFFVAAEFSGRGVGGALMRHVHETALSHGMKELVSHVSLTAQPFFKHYGFSIESEQYPVVRGIALRNAVMRKILAP